MNADELLVHTTTQLILQGPDEDPARFDAHVKALFFASEANAFAADCLCEIERCFPDALENVVPQLKARARVSDSHLALYVTACHDASFLPLALEALQGAASPFVKQLVVTRALAVEPNVAGLVEHRLRPLLASASPVYLHLALAHLTRDDADRRTASVANDVALPDSLRILALRWRAEQKFDPMASLPQPFDSLDVQTNAAHAVLAACLPRAAPDLFLLFDFVDDFALETPPAQRSAALFGLLIHALEAGTASSIVDSAADVLVSALLIGGSGHASWILSLVRHSAITPAQRAFFLQRLGDALAECKWDAGALLAVAEAVLSNGAVHPRTALQCVESRADAKHPRALWGCCHAALANHAPRLVAVPVERIVRACVGAVDHPVWTDEFRRLGILAQRRLCPPLPIRLGATLPPRGVDRPGAVFLDVEELPSSLSLSKQRVVYGAASACVALECELRCDGETLLAVEVAVQGAVQALIPVLSRPTRIAVSIVPPPLPAHALDVLVSIAACDCAGAVLRGTRTLALRFEDFLQPIDADALSRTAMPFEATVALSAMERFRGFAHSPERVAASVPPHHALELVGEAHRARVRASHPLLLAYVDS